MRKSRIFAILYLLAVGLTASLFAAEIHEAVKADDLNTVKALSEKDLGLMAGFLFGIASGQDSHGGANRETIDRMRDETLQPEKIMDAIQLRPGMIVGEAGSSYGYFTFKMSRRVGSAGIVFANDIDPAALRTITKTCESEKITNIRTVLGAVDDPLFPKSNLDMVIVFDCLFEFSEPAQWMGNARKYLKPEGRLVVVDPDPYKMGNSGHFLSREKIQDLARESGYAVIEVDDLFLKSHMIIVLQPIPVK